MQKNGSTHSRNGTFIPVNPFYKWQEGGYALEVHLVDSCLYGKNSEKTEENSE